MKREEWLLRVDTTEAVDENELEKVAGAAVEALLRAAAAAGLSIQELNALLDSGMRVAELFDYVASLVWRKAA